ncbi:MAG: hypothetical protein ABEJ86_07750 [Halococcoides sp.]
MRPLILAGVLAWALLVSLLTAGLRYRARGRSQDALVRLRIRMTTLAGAIGALIAIAGSPLSDSASVWQFLAPPIVGIGLPAIATGTAQVLVAAHDRDTDVEVSTVLRSWTRYVGGISLVLGAIILPVAVVLSRFPLTTSRVSVAVLLGLIAAGSLLLETCVPIFHRVMVSIRSVERSAIADGLAAVDRSSLPVRVQETRGNPLQRAYSRGVGPTERLYLTDNVLDRSDDIVTATVAMGAARTRVTARPAALGALIGTIGAAMSTVMGAPIVALLALVVGIGAAIYRWRAVFRADRIAADALGRDAVIDAIRETTIGSDRSLDWSRRRELLRVTPSPARRVDRLQHAPLRD